MSEPEPSLDTLLAYYQLEVPVTVGRATIAWNTLSRAVFDVYHLLSGMDHAAAKATFFVVASDRSQRDMVLSLVQTKVAPEHPVVAKRARSILGGIDALAGKRNDVLHIVLENEESPSKVRAFYERGHLKGKEGKELLSTIHDLSMKCLESTLELTKLRGDLLDLPPYKNHTLAKAVLLYIAQQREAGWPNRAGYGLLDVPATSPRSSEETQD